MHADLPKIESKPDWEVELAIVIGQAAKNVSEAEALDYVLGYTVANDVSGREWQIGTYSSCHYSCFCTLQYLPHVCRYRIAVS